MSRRTSQSEPNSVSALLVAGVLVLAGCGNKQASSKLCEQAAGKYAACIEEVLGAEMAAQARSTQREGIAACSKDDATQAMYKKCMPTEQCGAFLECLESFASDTGKQRSPAEPGASRKQQCEQHVRDGLRGVAAQAVILADSRDDASKRAAQRCVMDDSKDFKACLTETERALVTGYGEQRQRDCQSWEPATAACVLGLEGAPKCDPLEYPLWREPIAQGATGPAIAWSADLKEGDSDYADFLWLPEGTLVVFDDSGLRAIAAGRTLWSVKEQGKELVVTDGMIVTLGEGGGVVIRDPKTGKQRAEVLGDTQVLGDTEIRTMTPTLDGQLVALAEDGRLFRIQPARCKGRGKQCVKPDGSLGEQEVPYEAYLVAIGDDTLVVGGAYWLAAFDQKRNLLFKMEVGDSEDYSLMSQEVSFLSAAPPSHVALKDGMGVVVLDVRACAKGGKHLYLPFAAYVERSLGYRVGGPPEECSDCAKPPPGCVAGYRTSINGSWEDPISIAAGSVAFNDHGAVIESTHLLTADGPGWEVKTGGQGIVSGNEQQVYTVSFGQDGDGPVRLLALDRADGHTVWQADIPGAKPEAEEYDDVKVVVSERWLAVRIGDRVHAIELETAK